MIVGQAQSGPAPTGTSGKTTSIPQIAVIIPTYNEERNIGRLLESVRRQTVASEVVIVDQQSADRTVEIAKSYGCRIVEFPRPAFYTPPGASRNRGVAVSTAPILVHLDADMEFPGDDMLAHIIALIDDSHRAAVIHEIDVANGFWSRCKALERRCYWDTPMESARAVRRDLFDGVGGYDENISSGEDFYVDSLYRHNTVVVRDPRLILLHHPGHQTLFSLLSKKYRYGKTASRYLRKVSSSNGGHSTRPGILQASVRAYLGNMSYLFRDPVHYTGIFALRLMEFVAILAGMMSGAGVSRPS